MVADSWMTWSWQTRSLQSFKKQCGEPACFLLEKVLPFNLTKKQTG